jgi:hypothetical protein
MANTLLNR